MKVGLMLGRRGSKKSSLEMILRLDMPCELIRSIYQDHRRNNTCVGVLAILLAAEPLILV